MSDEGTDFLKLLDEARSELDAIVNDKTAGSALKKDAFERFESLSLLRAQWVIQKFEDRTEIVSDLISQLTAVTRNISVSNPAAAKVDKLVALVDRAKNLSDRVKALAKSG